MDNFWNDNTIFDKYVKACGSKFAAIMYVSKIARRRRMKVDGCITESQALAWVITGVEPKEVSMWRNNELTQDDKALIYAEDRIMYIEDLDIHDAVLHSITESRQAGHLIYRYKGLKNPYKKSRLRIICNMIWAEMKQLDVDNDISRRI